MRPPRPLVRFATTAVALCSSVVMVAATPQSVSAQTPSNPISQAPPASLLGDGSLGGPHAGAPDGPRTAQDLTNNAPSIGPGTSQPAAPPPADASPPATALRSAVPTAVDQQTWNRRPVERPAVKPPSKKHEPTPEPQTQVTPGAMRSDREQIPEGFTKADADKAETMEAALAGTATRDGFRAAAAPGCQVYWPAPYEVCGRIRDKYNSLGGPNSFLLFPKTNELTNPDRIGKRTEFQNGPIYWSPQGDAHPVVNHFLAAWARHGYENSYIGYPTTDEIVNPDGIGRRQHFTGSTIYWRLNEAYSVGGAIADKWATLGAERVEGLLGYPTSDEMTLPDGVGRMNHFERGVIYWHPSTGAHQVTGPILLLWSAAGYERSPFGYPAGSELFDQREELTQPFQLKPINLTTELRNMGTETFQGKEVNRWIMDQLRLLAQKNGFDLNTIFTSAEPRTNRMQALLACRTDYPKNPNTGGIEIPANYCYTGKTGDTLHEFCTKSPDEFPSPGANANFRGPCARHDLCYEANKGNRAAMRTCDSNFRNDLMRVCERVYTGTLDSARRQSCRGTALGYYSVVVGAHHENYL